MEKKWAYPEESFRKHLSEREIRLCKAIYELIGSENITVWNEKDHVPGYDEVMVEFEADSFMNKYLGPIGWLFQDKIVVRKDYLPDLYTSIQCYLAWQKNPEEQKRSL